MICPSCLRHIVHGADEEVSSITAQYDGTKYQLDWMAPKQPTVNYTVYYGTSPLENSDGTYNGNGTSGGSVAGVPGYQELW